MIASQQKKGALYNDKRPLPTSLRSATFPIGEGFWFATRQQPSLLPLPYSLIPAISRATYTPLAEAWLKECVTPEPSPMT